MDSGCVLLLKYNPEGFLSASRFRILDHITSRPLPADNMADPADVDDTTGYG